MTKMQIFKFILWSSAFTTTFGIALPWLINNNIIPLPIGVCLIICILTVWAVQVFRAAKNFYFKHKDIIDDLIN